MLAGHDIGDQAGTVLLDERSLALGCRDGSLHPSAGPVMVAGDGSLLGERGKGNSHRPGRVLRETIPCHTCCGDLELPCHVGVPQCLEEVFPIEECAVGPEHRQVVSTDAIVCRILNKGRYTDVLPVLGVLGDKHIPDCKPEPPYFPLRTCARHEWKIGADPLVVVYVHVVAQPNGGFAFTDVLFDVADP